jgi:hypothetical protein
MYMYMRFTSLALDRVYLYVPMTYMNDLPSPYPPRSRDLATREFCGCGLCVQYVYVAVSLEAI